MPLQNRVAPTGEIVAHPGRGMFTGNQGCLHTADRRLGAARWRSKAWICCVLDWKGRVRDPMPPGRWTALFFLDEATALAAGHRPCAYCRRADFLAFAWSWGRARGLRDPATGAPVRGRAAEMDAQLHRERVDPRSRRQVVRPVRVGKLPDGVLLRHRDVVGLWQGGWLWPWSFGGYGPPVAVPYQSTVDLLTPPATAAAIAAGYRPRLHPSVAGTT